MIIYTLSFMFHTQKQHLKKILVDKFPLRQCFDCDNVIKGLCDALEESKIINDDRLFSSMFIEKFRTVSEVGRIEFELQTFKDNPIHEG